MTQQGLEQALRRYKQGPITMATAIPGEEGLLSAIAGERVTLANAPDHIQDKADRFYQENIRATPKPNLAVPEILGIHPAPA